MTSPRRIEFHPYAAEFLTYGAASVVFIGLAAAGLPPSARSASWAVRTTAATLPLAFVIGVGGQALWWGVTRRSVRAYLRQATRLDWLVAWLRLWLVCMVTSYAYFWLKVFVPLLNGASWDAAFWSLDRAVHLGVSPNLLAIELLPASTALRLLDYWYGLWLVTLVAGIAICAASVDSRERRGFVLSCVLVWSLGAAGYLAFPAVGPAYAFSSAFAELASNMPIAAASQALLWSNYSALQSGAAEALGGVDHTKSRRFRACTSRSTRCSRCGPFVGAAGSRSYWL